VLRNCDTSIIHVNRVYSRKNFWTLKVKPVRVTAMMVDDVASSERSTGPLIKG